jgi:hypothetical protein
MDSGVSQQSGQDVLSSSNIRWRRERGLFPNGQTERPTNKLSLFCLVLVNLVGFKLLNEKKPTKLECFLGTMKSSGGVSDFTLFLNTSVIMKGE